MLQYVLTGLAGIVLGIVGMRVWLSREEAASSAPDDAAPADDAQKAPGSTAASNGRTMLIAAGVMAVLAVAVLVLRPAGDDADPAALAAQPAGAGPSAQQLADVDTMISGLAARLAKNPNDGEGFRMLGWSYMMTGHPDKAIEPYQRALALTPKNPLVHSGLGEAMVGVAGGKVTPEAKAAFDKAIALDPKDPRARYFLALLISQNGDPKKALDLWLDLANSGPADAPWQADLRKQIADTSARLGVDVSGRLKPAAAGAGAAVAPVAAGPLAGAAGPMAGAAPQLSVDQMVDGLAGKLKANPDNPDGWVMLMRSRMVLKQAEQAGRDLATARKALGGNAQGLAKVNAAARELGIPGA